MHGTSPRGSRKVPIFDTTTDSPYAAGSATLGCVDPRPTVAALGALLAVGATACGASGNGVAVPMVAKLDVARGVSDEVGAQRHTLAPVVACPNDLPREVGSSEQCSETDLTPGGRHGVSVRIDRIDGAGIHYSVVVGTAPLPPPGD